MKVHLGVLEQPYTGEEEAITTGDVATILEAKYHVMGVYAFLHLDKMAENLEGALAGSLESQLMGAPEDANVFGTAESAIEENFKAWLSSGDIERWGFPGIPTKAAISRRSLRRKGKVGPKRPSFIDTGLYQASFKVWVDE